MPHDGFAQKIISLFRTVSVETFRMCHFVHRPVHRLYRSLRERTRHVTDAQAYQTDFRMGRLERTDSFGYLREQIVSRKLYEVFIY